MLMQSRDIAIKRLGFTWKSILEKQTQTSVKSVVALLKEKAACLLSFWLKQSLYFYSLLFCYHRSGIKKLVQ